MYNSEDECIKEAIRIAEYASSGDVKDWVEVQCAQHPEFSEKRILDEVERDQQERFYNMGF